LGQQGDETLVAAVPDEHLTMGIVWRPLAEIESIYLSLVQLRYKREHMGVRLSNLILANPARL
jgi:hypothetical protein